MDIREPEYCVLSENYEEEESAGVDVNAWFGPANTLSPLHYDTKHNFLVQVMFLDQIITRSSFPTEGTQLGMPST